MESTVNREVQILVANLRKKCDSGDWKGDIKSLDDLKNLVARVTPQIPLSPTGPSSTTVEPVRQQEAEDVARAFKEHVSKLRKASTDGKILKKDLLFIKYIFSILVHVLGEDYKSSGTTVIDDAAHTAFKRTLRQGLKTVLGATELGPVPGDDIAVDRFVKKCVTAHALLHDLSDPRKDELPYHHPPLLTLADKSGFKGAREYILQNLKSLKLKETYTWNSSDASASKIVARALNGRLSDQTILQYLGIFRGNVAQESMVKDESGNESESAPQSIPLKLLISLSGVIHQLRGRAVASALSTQVHLSSVRGTENISSGRTGPPVLFTFELTEECKAYSRFCDKALREPLSDYLRSKGLILQGEEPDGQYLSRLEVGAILWPTPRFVNVLLPLFNVTRQTRMQSSSSKEDLVIEWEPNMALFFHGFGIVVTDTWLRYVHLLYTFHKPIDFIFYKP